MKYSSTLVEGALKWCGAPKALAPNVATTNVLCLNMYLIQAFLDEAQLVEDALLPGREGIQLGVDGTVVSIVVRRQFVGRKPHFAT